MTGRKASGARHTFQCKECGYVTPITPDDELKCERCGSKSGIYSPVVPDEPGPSRDLH